MNDASFLAFDLAIQARYGARCFIVAQLPVHAPFDGATMIHGHVFVFELLCHPEPIRCYAWEVDDQIITVLESETVNTPVRAVATWLTGEAQGQVRATDPTLALSPSRRGSRASGG